MKKKQGSGFWALLLALCCVSVLGLPLVHCGPTTVVDEKKDEGSTGGNKDGSDVDTPGKAEPRGEPAKAEPRPEPARPEPPAAEPRPEPAKPEPTPGEPAKPEPTADAGPQDLPPLPDGPVKSKVFKATKLILSQDGSEGIDLTGDNKVDNQLGKALGNSNIKALLQLASVDVQKQIDDQVNNETLILLLELQNLSDPTTQSGTVDVAVYLGKKTGTAGVYTIDPQSLDLQGKPRVYYAKSTVKNGVVTTPTGSFSLILSLLQGRPPVNMELKKSRMSFTITNNLTLITKGSVGGALPAATLDLIPTIGSFGSVFDLLIQAAGTDGQPDIDLDNDGVEKFTRNGSTTECTDGDGTTKVTAPSPCPNNASTCGCVQNAKIADGYSAYMKFEASPAQIQR